MDNGLPSPCYPSRDVDFVSVIIMALDLDFVSVQLLKGLFYEPLATIGSPFIELDLYFYYFSGVNSVRPCCYSPYLINCW